MPDRDDEEALKRAREDAAEGKAPSTQAGEFVREEIEHVREGKHGARSPKQAIAIGLSEARKEGSKAPAKSKASSEKKPAPKKAATKTQRPAVKKAASKTQKPAAKKAATKTAKAGSGAARKTEAKKKPGRPPLKKAAGKTVAKKRSTAKAPAKKSS